jgi:hypothetical protein
MVEIRNAYKILIVKPEGMGPLERAKRRWKDNVKMDFPEIRWLMGVSWIHLNQDRNQWQVLAYNFMPYKPWNFLTS